METTTQPTRPKLNRAIANQVRSSNGPAYQFTAEPPYGAPAYPADAAPSYQRSTEASRLKQKPPNAHRISYMRMDVRPKQLDLSVIDEMIKLGVDLKKIESTFADRDAKEERLDELLRETRAFVEGEMERTRENKEEEVVGEGEMDIVTAMKVLQFKGTVVGEEVENPEFGEPDDGKRKVVNPEARPEAAKVPRKD